MTLLRFRGFHTSTGMVSRRLRGNYRCAEMHINGRHPVIVSPMESFEKVFSTVNLSKLKIRLSHSEETQPAVALCTESLLPRNARRIVSVFTCTPTIGGRSSIRVAPPTERFFFLLFSGDHRAQSKVIGPCGI